MFGGKQQSYEKGRREAQSQSLFNGLEAGFYSHSELNSKSLEQISADPSTNRHWPNGHRVHSDIAETRDEDQSGSANPEPTGTPLVIEFADNDLETTGSNTPTITASESHTLVPRATTKPDNPLTSTGSTNSEGSSMNGPTLTTPAYTHTKTQTPTTLTADSSTSTNDNPTSPGNPTDATSTRTGTSSREVSPTTNTPASSSISDSSSTSTKITSYISSSTPSPSAGSTQFSTSTEPNSVSATTTTLLPSQTVSPTGSEITSSATSTSTSTDSTISSTIPTPSPTNTANESTSSYTTPTTSSSSESTTTYDYSSTSTTKSSTLSSSSSSSLSFTSASTTSFFLSTTSSSPVLTSSSSIVATSPSTLSIIMTTSFPSSSSKATPSVIFGQYGCARDSHAVQGHCAPGYFCNATAGACIHLFSDGEPCSESFQCQSSHCGFNHRCEAAQQTTPSALSGGAIAGITIGVIVGVIGPICGLLWYYRRSHHVGRRAARFLDEERRQTRGSGRSSGRFSKFNFLTSALEKQQQQQQQQEEEQHTAMPTVSSMRDAPIVSRGMHSAPDYHRPSPSPTPTSGSTVGSFGRGQYRPSLVGSQTQLDQDFNQWIQRGPPMASEILPRPFPPPFVPSPTAAEHWSHENQRQ
ncbi:hypothetical protein EC973_008741 [Apophysomyces ossiformis]|uniref:Uncharacterized protein n=1 Tax=Apophysomyces ossiformis TaxID=679940 RepID=A0A8H7BKJ8_9FUNG|nr:hypothetical protein EC973_008741 [Apophysomyces ossiformis]